MKEMSERGGGFGEFPKEGEESDKGSEPLVWMEGRDELEIELRVLE